MVEENGAQGATGTAERGREPDTMSEHTYTAVFEPDEDGGFVVTCPALPGLVTHGDSLEEARAMAVDAIGLYLESVLADGERLPISEENVPGTIREPVTVTLPAVIDTDEQLAQLECAGAGDELLRIINRPKWRGPGPEPAEEETMEMVAGEIKRMRRERQADDGDG